MKKAKMTTSQKIRSVLLIAAISMASVLSVAPSHADAPDQQLNIYR